jgi:isopenicillin-N N-acyltransferase like protein
VEAAPHAVCQIRPTDGMLAHANHFLASDRLEIWQPLVEEKRSTFHRCERMQQLLSKARETGGISEDALRDILRDHDEFPNSVCRHQDQTKPEAERYQTVISTIMDLHAGSMLVATGPPCEHTYLEFSL